MTPELSWKTDNSQSTFFDMSLVGATMCVLNKESMVYLVSSSASEWLIFAEKILWLQCSDHVCARHSSSTSVGVFVGRLYCDLIRWVS